jgi:lysophospholipase L1-like esterase
MESSRRDFIRKLGISGIAAVGFNSVFPAQDIFLTHPTDKTNKGLTILFQGDSITDGNRTRNNDWNHIMGHGYAYLIASRLWFDYPDEGLMLYNRGISGNRVSDLKKRWKEDALDLKPDVISILIGINDVMAIVKGWEPDPIEKFEEDYITILEQTKTNLPETRIVLCEPFILTLGWVNEKTDVWQTELVKRQEILRKLVKTYDTIFVGLQEHFNKACEKAPAEYWIWDGVHPMPAGHELIARIWLKEAGKALPFL